jgi:NhaA family Na+:H+ antiporter
LTDGGPDDVGMRHGPSEPALRALDTIHERIESPASKLLRGVEPWSSYVVLPVFALANAGLVWTSSILDTHARLVVAIVLGLVVGKPLGIVAGAWLAVRLNVAAKPEAYTWRQLAGAGAFGGIGFTMSLFIASQAFSNPADFTAAKLAVFGASLIASLLGTLLLFPRRDRPPSRLVAVRNGARRAPLTESGWVCGEGGRAKMIGRRRRGPVGSP